MVASDSSKPAAAVAAADKSAGSDGSVVDTMLASALSGMLARVPLHPIDTCKAKLQVQQQFVRAAAPTPVGVAAPIGGGTTNAKSFAQFFSYTLRTEGVRGLYSGFGITFAGSAPAACLYFTSYEASKSFLGSFSVFQSTAPFFTHFLSGLLAECCSCVLWVPIDVVKERLQVQQQLREMMTAGVGARSAAATAAVAPSVAAAPPAMLYRGNIDAIRTIARTEGLRGVYRGYGATVASFGPFSAIYLSGYEQFKDFFGKLLAPKEYERSRTSSDAAVELPFLAYALSGAAAGSVASVLTNPLDLVKLRLQVQRGNSGFTFGYRGIVDGVASVVREEGTRALFKGAAARCLFHIPSTALTIAMFDTLKNHLHKIRTTTL